VRAAFNSRSALVRMAALNNIPRDIQGKNIWIVVVSGCLICCSLEKQSPHKTTDNHLLCIERRAAKTEDCCTHSC
jgi:hypothetical protein